MNVDVLRKRLEASRAALLAALEGVTERDFAAELEPGVTVVEALGALPPAERAAIHEARLTIGAPERPLPAGGATVTARPTPPQVVHDLAGARYETLLFLDLLDGSTPPDGHQNALATLLLSISEREMKVAGAVRGRISTERARPA